MNKKKFLEFLLKARMKTYATGGGKMTPAFPKMYQLEHKEDEFIYRDIYNMGNGIFMGLKTVYFQDTPVLSMSYFGNFVKITEEEVDAVLRKALMDKWDTTRLWHDVKWKSGRYEYVCEIDASGSIDEFSGTEKILKDGKEVYSFYYAGGFIG